jgi:hypothetical protein
VNASGETCKYFTLESGIDLEISSQTFAVAGDSDDSTIESGATVRLSTSGSIISFSNNHTINIYDTGDILGEIRGEHINAQLAVGSGTLRSRTNIRGALQVNADSSAYFRNDGTVEADDGTADSDTLSLLSGTIHADSSGEWLVSASGATLQFHEDLEANVSVSGDVRVSNSGTLDVDKAFSTTGDLFITYGTIITEGVTFNAGVTP